MTNILKLPLYTATIRTKTHDEARASIRFESGEPPAALSLEGITFRAQLRADVRAAIADLEISTAAGSLIVSGAENEFLSFAIQEEEMSRLPPGEYVFDVVASGDGVERTVLEGKWIHELRVTR